ncbi:MAG: TonB-dependent receptor [Bryobacterales bacterium]|nr:TonB-dependent receptor [Bryobacterales bacterium]
MRLLLYCLLAAPAAAQVTTGSVSGFILDPSQRPIAAARVEARSSETGVERRVRTDASGYYLLAELPPGTYDVQAEAPGFEPVEAPAVRVTVNTRARADFALPVAGVRSSLEVSARVKRIETESADLGLVLDRTSIQRLPLNRREFLQLALLAPGVMPPVQNSELSARGSFAMHSGGAREEFNNYLIDGADNNDQYLNTFALQPSVDAIEEFKIATNAYSAEYGRNAGGQVNVITRGGTNQVHGALYEYLRNRVFDARNFFAPDRPKLIRNQFGGAAGGPLRRDRTFYFVNADALRERRGLTRLGVVPSLAEREGDFAASGATVFDPFTRQPFPGNRIPANRISPVGRQVLGLFPLPNREGAVNHVAQPTLREGLSQVHARADHRLSSAGQLTLRYSFGEQDLSEPFAEELTDIAGFGNVVQNRSHNAMAQHTHAFSPAVIHTLRLGFGRNIRQVQAENAGRDVGREWGVGWLNVAERDRGYPLFNVAGYSAVGDPAQLPIGRHINTYQAIESVALTRGAHTLKLGAEVRHQRLTGFLDYFARGSLSFSGQLSGSGLSDLLLGFPSFGLQAQFDNRQALRSTATDFYAQDDWKLHPSLTLNLGVRYEFRTPPVDPADRMAIFDPAAGQVVNVGSGGFSRSGLRADRNNLAPRVGLAWSFAPDWVLRSGYGVYYDASMLVINSSLYFNPPYFNVRVFFPTAQGLLTLDDPFPAGGGITPPPSPNTLNPDLVTAYLQHWNFGVQRQLGASAVVSLAYAGSKGTQLIRSRDANQPRPGPGNLQGRRPNPAFGGIFFTENGANSNFHSLQASVDRRFARSFAILASYTYSKSIDEASAFLGVKADKNFPQDSRNTRAERAVSSFDMPHRFVAAATWLPQTRAWWSRRWELRSIVTAQAGQPFTPVLRFDNSNTGNSGGIFGLDRPNLVGDPKLAARTPERWFDTGAFAVAPPFTFGNAGRNIVRGPGVLQFDLAAGRRFILSERFTLLTDAQAFNLFNRTQFDLPELFADQPSTFGRIFSARPPRQLQFALRLEW